MSPSITAGGQRSCGRRAAGRRRSHRRLARLLRWRLNPPKAWPADPAPEALIDLLLELRRALRNAKQWQLSDQARGGLSALGISLQDSPAGTTWTRVS